MNEAMLLQMARQAAVPQRPAGGPVLATPFNDAQLVSLMAAALKAGALADRSPARCVETAIELLAESVVQLSGNAVEAALAKARARLNLAGK